MPAPTTERTVQRPEIQGLRAVAVLLVLVFHLWPDHLAGGYVGVDVFFVISGFLITSLLLRELDRSGTVSLREFWARRMRRLLPAALLVLAVSAVGTLLLEPRSVWPQFLREILAAGLYVENWILALDSVNYLAAENTASPAQHYWTLSAEEQFYVVWPLLALLATWIAVRAGRSRRTTLFVVLTVAVVASLGYSLWITVHDPGWAYFVTPARAWEFGAGALLAFAPAPRGHTLPRVLVGWAGLATLVACAVALDATTPMPGTAAMVVVLAAAAVIWVADPPGMLSHARLLTLRPARWLGDVSYATYLWHWPLIILVPSLTGHRLTTFERIDILLGTLVLAALTTKWVEDPVRRTHRWRLSRPLVTFACTGLAVALLAVLCLVPRELVLHDNEQSVAAARDLARKPPACFGAAAMDPHAEGCPNPVLADAVVPEPAAAAEDIPGYSKCYAEAFRDGSAPCRFGSPSADVPHVAVIGDSHARVLMSTVEPLVEQGLLTADMYVMGECAWSTTPPDTSREIGRTCARWRDQLYPALSRRADEYDAVLTTARLATLRGSRTEQVAGLSQAWRRLTSQDVPVAVVRDNPGVGLGESADDPNLCLEKVQLAEADQRCSFTRTGNLDRWYDALAAAQRATPGARLVDLTDLLCGPTTCPVVIGGADVYADGNHLTVTFARTLAPYLYRALRAEGLV